MKSTTALDLANKWRNKPRIRPQPAVAREVAYTLADRVLELEQQIQLLKTLVVGTPVFIHRGTPGRGPDSGPGFGRFVPAIIEEAPVGVAQVQCRLVEDDPAAVCSPYLAGESGVWALSQIKHAACADEGCAS